MVGELQVCEINEDRWFASVVIGQPYKPGDEIQHPSRYLQLPGDERTPSKNCKIYQYMFGICFGLSIVP